MSKFIIQPHGRLQEWIADANGYFRDEGLDYEFGEMYVMNETKVMDGGKIAEVKTGAFESYKDGGGNKGAKSDISCACHWAVNQASAQNIGKMWGKSYVVSPGGIMVHPDSKIENPEDLAGQEIAVGYHSGSHFTTIQAVEPFVKPEDIKLTYIGRPWARVDAVMDRDVPASTVFGLTFQALEQLGYRKIVDCTFMIGFMFPDHVAESDVQKYMNALKRAQMELDFRPEKYKHFYVNEIPDRYRKLVNVRRFNTGERVVFLPYTEQMYKETQDWIHEHGIFEERPPVLDYAARVAAE
jgi:NitT/TauT family transport system substrate-binding protein